MSRECSGRVLVCAWLVLGGPLAAQDVSPAQMTTDPTAITQSRLDEFQQRVAAQADLDEAAKTQIAELLGQATNDLKAAADGAAQAARAEASSANLDSEKADLERQFKQPGVSTSLSEQSSLSDLESEQVELQTQITRLEQELKQPKIDPAARTANRTALRMLLTELPARIDELEQQFKEPPPETDPALLSEARKLAQGAQKQALEARLKAARAELALYDAADAISLPTLRRELKTRELIARRKRLEAIRNEVNVRRQAEAERRAREARLAALSAQPVLRPIFEENLEIARAEQELRDQHEADKQLLQEVQKRFKEIDEDYDQATVLDEEIGLENRGIWLRKQRERLAELQPLYEQVEARTDRTTDVIFGFYERTDQLERLADLEAAADQLTAEAAVGTIERDTFREDAVQVLRSQAVNLQKLVDEYSDYADTLAALESEAGKLRAEAEEYGNFLDERILWVRSHLPLSLASLTGQIGTLGSLLSADAWVAAIKSLGWDAADHLMLYGSVVLLLIYLLVRRSGHAGQLQEVARRAGGRVTVSLAPTVHCLVLTVLLALVWPGLLLFVAWRVHESTISSPQLQVAALNLMRLASLFFLLEFVRQSIRPMGLAEAHFAWNGKTLRCVRRLLRLVMLIGLPLAAAAACLHQQELGSRRDDVERVLFIGAMLVLMLLSHLLFHPARGALSQMKALQDGGWFDRLHHLWYAVGLAVPIGLIVLTVLGYFDSAVRLALRVEQTAWLIVAAVYLHALINRWLMLRHRRLRIQDARERLAAAQETPGGALESESPLPEVDAGRSDIDTINEQSQRLVRTLLVVACLVGLWWIWIDVLPAIRFLDRWPIWETTVQTIRTETDDATGEIQNRPVYEVHTVTIASLIQVLIIGLLTSTAARNVPGLLEMSILARLPIDRSTAYAMTSLTRYALVLIGMILAGQTLGLTWSRVQWLAAALTFGLGFGLQEIFANFVSGLIILFEQPVRVGDIVTIDGVSGVVNRIRIRATTIVDWDRKEYIVPNREFITGRLLNWTLSDKMNRLVVEVAVAFESDVQKVRQIILNALEEHPNILSDPGPLVTFESFGESSLKFVGRAYLPNLDNRLSTIHDLHTAIHERLPQAGIRIPYPQRDLHLRTSVAIDQARHGDLSSNGRQESEEGSAGNPAPRAAGN